MPSKFGKATSYPLRLPLTMRRELTALAKREGISINQLINLAVAEKIIRYQQQTGTDHAVETSSPTHHELPRIQQLEPRAPVFGASFALESVQHRENLASLGMPATLTKSAG